jgi:Uma2 family endonuclease
MVTGRAIFWAGMRPVAFEEFLRRFGADREVELLDGTAVARMPVPIEHDRLRAWLHGLIAEYLKATKQGTLYDGATPIAISRRRGRRPDLFFVSRACRGIVRRNAAYGAPDLIIEIVSTCDLRSDLTARERDYCALGVPEILFLDPVRRQTRVLRRRDGGAYTEETLLPGATLHLDTLPGLTVPTTWLFSETARPPIWEALDHLRAAV